ncbi:MAG: HPr kinase/phosphorylase [Clostridiales bacterium]|nr:HPr kinase/phosphorylase [Clostridiales bacterium]
MIQAASFAKALQLKELSPSSKKEWDLRSADLNRPGMQFCGFYDYFPFERPQVVGKVEVAYLDGMDPAQRRSMLETYFSYDMPCVVICRGLTPPDDLLEIARAHDTAVYQTAMVTTKFNMAATNYLNQCLAPRVTRHGVLVDVYGVGVLLTGESGVGKSEAALELVKRGHQLVADDVVDICRVSDNRLVGECPEMVRHFMEIRGIGIIDIRAMYGVSAIAVSKTIDLVMHLEHWVEGKEYDRLGLSEDTINILGVKVPCQITPVRPGRNMAIIIEVAARNLSLKRLGYSAAHELDRRMNEMIMRKSQENED